MDILSFFSVFCVKPENLGFYNPFLQPWLQQKNI